MARRTKIIATIGPACDDPIVLEELIAAGMDVARINLAHGTLDESMERYRRIRKASEAVGRPVGVLVDLPGPKVRVGSFGDDGVMFVEGEQFRMVPGRERSTHEVVEVDYDGLLSDIRIGDRLSMGDGSLVLEVLDRRSDALAVEVVHGGRVLGRPGVHIPSDRLSAGSPTRADLRLLDVFVEEDVDMVAVSFVRSAHDVRRVGTEPHPRGPLIVAKIETRAAVDNLEGIIKASGAVMVARGDLGAECPIEEIPHLQKSVIRACIALGRPAITATQMLESMVQAPVPTRAEASDVANAVFDGSSAVMLSGETAVGRDPVNSVATMARIAETADREFDYDGWAGRLSRDGFVAEHYPEEPDPDTAITDAMTAATWRAASQLNLAAIICLSRTGHTVRSIARFRPRARLLGFSQNERTVRQLTMSWGATPILIDQLETNELMVDRAILMAREHGEIRSGDMVAVLAGSSDRSPSADVLRLLRVP